MRQHGGARQGPQRRAAVVVLGFALGSCAPCGPEPNACGSEHELIVRFEDTTTLEDNVAVIAARGERIARMDAATHHFTVETVCVYEAWDYYDARPDVRYTVPVSCSSTGGDI
jgi:hypothetical protein